jgi:hypothetical protein
MIWPIRIPCIHVHVSCMYHERILMRPVHIHQDTSGYNKIHLQIRTSLDTIEIHVSHYVSLMYPACILNVILNVSSNLCRYMYPACIPHVSHVQDTYILMYLICIPKFFLDFMFGIHVRVKYMQTIKIHVFSWNVTGHSRYI